MNAELPDTLDMQIETLVRNTYDRQIREYGDKFTNHEQAYGIMQSRVVDVGEELWDVDTILKLMHKDIQENNAARFDFDVKILRKHSVNLIKDAIRVVALCDKCENGFE